MKNLGSFKHYAWTILAFLLCLWFLYPSAMAGQVVIGSGDLPYTTVSNNDTITFDANYITTSGSGIIVNHTGIVIDLQDDTLGFGDGTGSDNVGVTINSDGTKILGNADSANGGLILHGGTTVPPDSAYDNNCVTLNGSWEDIIIDSVDMEIYGWNGHNIEYPTSFGVSLTVRGGYWITHNDGFTSRGTMDAASTEGRTDNAVVIFDNINIDTWHAGLRWGVQSGTGYVRATKCTIYVDAKNDLYSYPSGNFYWSSVQAAGISCYNCGAGTIIDSNYIMAGEDNEGCDEGILLDRPTGTVTDTIKVFGNYVNIHRGPDDHYGDALPAKCYKQRWMCKYVHIHDNTFIVTTATDLGAAWGINGKGLEINSTSSDYGEEGTFLDSFIIVENNRIFVEALSSGCTAQGAEISIRGEDESPYYDWTGAGNVWRNNYLKSTYYGYYLGKQDVGACRGFVAQGDTLESYGDGDYDSYRVGYYNKPCTANVLRDMTYLGGATEGDYEWRESYGADLRIEGTFEVLVQDGSSDPLEGAIITITDSDDSTIVDTTDANGNISPVLRYAKYIYGSSDIDYNDFAVHTTWNGFTEYDTVTLDWENISSTITVVFDERRLPLGSDSIMTTIDDLAGLVYHRAHGGGSFNSHDNDGLALLIVTPGDASGESVDSVMFHTYKCDSETDYIMGLYDESFTTLLAEQTSEGTITANDTGWYTVTGWTNHVNLADYTSYYLVLHENTDDDFRFHQGDMPDPITTRYHLTFNLEYTGSAPAAASIAGATPYGTDGTGHEIGPFFLFYTASSPQDSMELVTSYNNVVVTDFDLSPTWNLPTDSVLLYGTQKQSWMCETPSISGSAYETDVQKKYTSSGGNVNVDGTHSPEWQGACDGFGEAGGWSGDLKPGIPYYHRAEAWYNDVRYYFDTFTVARIPNIWDNNTFQTDTIATDSFTLFADIANIGAFNPTQEDTIIIVSGDTLHSLWHWFETSNAAYAGGLDSFPIHKALFKANNDTTFAYLRIESGGILKMHGGTRINVLDFDLLGGLSMTGTDTITKWDNDTLIYYVGSIPRTKMKLRWK